MGNPPPETSYHFWKLLHTHKRKEIKTGRKFTAGRLCLLSTSNATDEFQWHEATVLYINPVKFAFVDLQDFAPIIKQQSRSICYP